MQSQIMQHSVNENFPMWHKNETICEQRKPPERGKKCLFCMVDEQQRDDRRGADNLSGKHKSKI